MHPSRLLRLLPILAVLSLVWSTPAPADPGREDFLVVGDWGRDGRFGQSEVAAQMGRTAAEVSASFVISVGDNFYPDGVTSTDDPRWQSSFEAIYTHPALQRPWYAVLGNHDYHADAQAQVDYTLVSPRWKMPARYFRLVRRIDADTTAEFFFLDTNPFLKGYRANPTKFKGILDQDTAAQTAWLDAALARSTARWKIVVGHHPIRSASPTHGDTGELVDTILPLMRKHGAKIYLNGHEHDLQHLSQDGIHFICSGAGSQTRQTRQDERTLFSIGETPGFLHATLSRDRMTLRFIDAVGTVLYETEIEP